MGVMANSQSVPPVSENSPEVWEGARFLEFEREHWGHAPGKEDRVFREFSLGLAAYYHRLYRFCRSRDALVYDAHLSRSILDAASTALTTRLRSQGGEG
jgi:hypothetical protein